VTPGVAARGWPGTSARARRRPPDVDQLVESSDRLADNIGVLVEQHLPDDLLDRHPVGTGHRWRLLSSHREKSTTILSARVAGTTFRPTPTYTTLRDVTRHEHVDAGFPRSTRLV
jgi:hypothetical protein